MKKFNVIWENITKKDYEKVVQRTTQVEARDDFAAIGLMFKQFGNGRKIKIIGINEVKEIPVEEVGV